MLSLLQISIKEQFRKLSINLGLFGLCFTFPLISPNPVVSAERINLNYGVLGFSLSVESLEKYLNEGLINPDLKPYTNFLSPEQLDQLKNILSTKADLTPLAVSQFLYSPQGEAILNRIGQLVQTRTGQSGFYALRSALILSAADPEGLSLLNVLRKFPSPVIKINSEYGFEVIEQLSSIIASTNQASTKINQKVTQERLNEPPLDFFALPDLRQLGMIGFQKRTLILNDLKRNRAFPVDFYLPEISDLERKIPVIIISHGLGSDRETFDYLARHFASYGFAVLVPEHPGSNAEQLGKLLQGFTKEVTPPEELVDRPLDIKYLLDQMEKSWSNILDLNNVGIVGQSFGGYTALSVAGANFNLEKLTQTCPNLQDFLNFSILLQCRVLDLPKTDYQFQDPRIKASLAINPLTSLIFGEEQLNKINIPVMFIASSSDTITPALEEQIQPFTTFNNPNKYLVLLEKGTHFSTLAESESAFSLPPEAIGPDPAIAHFYLKALSLAFFKTYLSQDPSYKIYLSASYAKTISNYNMPLSLLQSLSETDLKPR
jgi:predicted dienelactone hydrolase